LNKCDADYRKQVLETLKKTCNVDSLSNLPTSLFDRVKAAAEKKKSEFEALMVA
jgi:hypothetical protein